MNAHIEAVGYVATAMAASQFVPQVIRTSRSHDTAGVSSGMFAILVAQAGAWMGYGIRQHLFPPVLTNVMLGYCGIVMVRLLVINRAPHIRRAIAAIIGALVFEVLAYLFAPDAVLGVVAAVGAFILLWPQVLVVFTRTDLSGLSLGSWLLSIGNTILWMAYGLGRHSMLLLLSAGQGLVLSLVIVARMMFVQRHARTLATVVPSD